MGRSIITGSSASIEGSSTRGGLDEDEFENAKPSNSDDRYSDKLIKLIPAEVVGVYISMMAVLKGSSEAIADILPWFVFGFGVVATYFYLRFSLHVSERRQLVVSVVAFCVWAYTLGGPFKDAGLHSDTVSGLLLAAWTFAAPKIPMKAVP